MMIRFSSSDMMFKCFSCVREGVFAVWIVRRWEGGKSESRWKGETGLCGGLHRGRCWFELLILRVDCGLCIFRHRSALEGGGLPHPACLRTDFVISLCRMIF